MKSLAFFLATSLAVCFCTESTAQDLRTSALKGSLLILPLEPDVNLWAVADLGFEHKFARRTSLELSLSAAALLKPFEENNSKAMVSLQCRRYGSEVWTNSLFYGVVGQYFLNKKEEIEDLPSNAVVLYRKYSRMGALGPIFGSNIRLGRNLFLDVHAGCVGQLGKVTRYKRAAEIEPFKKTVHRFELDALAFWGLNLCVLLLPSPKSGSN